MWTESQTRQKPKDRVRLKVSVSRNRKKQKAAEDWPHSKTQAWTQAQRVSEGFGVRPVLSAAFARLAVWPTHLITPPGTLWLLLKLEDHFVAGMDVQFVVNVLKVKPDRR